MMVARFAGPDEVVDALRRLRAAGVPAESRTPVALPGDEEGHSRLPLMVLAAALVGGAGAFGMQWYANAISYPLIVGGRPAFFWTSYLLFALECGFLAGTLTAFIGFFAANRLPKLYEPADESELLRTASRAGWCVLTGGADAPARRVLRELHPQEIEHVPAESPP